MTMRSYQLFQVCLVFAALTWAASAQPIAETDCALPDNTNYDMKLAEESDIVVTGLAVSSLAPGTPACVPRGAISVGSSSGPDLLVQEGDQEDGSQVMMFWAQCVHKGALACRTNEVDDTIRPPRCLIAVRVPKQATAEGELPPCTVARGLRYTLLLSSKPSASCDGVYDIQHSRITDSVRTHVGLKACTPYPAWPSQDTSVNGTGLAGLLGRSCPSSTAPEVAQCTGDSDPCTGQAACPEASAITCVPKACVGKYMVDSKLLSVEPCQPVFLSKVSGLPVISCGVTTQRLTRQARQADKRLSTDAQSSSSDGTAQLPGLPSLQSP